MQHPMKPPLLDRTSGSGNLARRGAVVLELLIALPLLVIGSMAAVEMGLWMTGQQRLEMAARIGAEEAAASANMDQVDARVRNYLEQANVPTENLQLRLHAFDGGIGRTYLEPRDADWSGIQLPPEPQSNSAYVQLVVRLPSSNLAPNLLQTFGFDLTSHWTVRAKTLRYEGAGR